MMEGHFAELRKSLFNQPNFTLSSGRHVKPHNTLDCIFLLTLYFTNYITLYSTVFTTQDFSPLSN